LDEELALAILGIVLVGYSLYALLGLRLPKLKNKAWAYAAGFLGGLLGGAYNTPGPPVIMYASCKEWEPDVFKANLQSFFVQNSVFVVFGHWMGGSFTPEVRMLFLRGLPWLGAGILTGFWLDRWINPKRFRQLIFLLLIVMGIKLIF
jgi:uncharacterized membrane protein YfcA